MTRTPDWVKRLGMVNRFWRIVETIVHNTNTTIYLQRRTILELRVEIETLRRELNEHRR